MIENDEIYVILKLYNVLYLKQQLLINLEVSE